MRTRRISHAGEITFEGWSWGTGRGGSDQKISKVVTEVLRSEFSDLPPSLDLPAAWGDGDGLNGPPVSDPLTIYVAVDAVGEEFGGPVWSLTLSELIAYELESHQEPSGLSEEGRRFVRSVRDRLHSIVVELDETLASEGKSD